MVDIITVKITKSVESISEPNSFYIRGKVLQETKNCDKGIIHFVYNEKLKVGKEYKISYKNTLSNINYVKKNF